ncbi:MAG: AAA family ATPase [Candidatus Parvarchaeota archaeon]|nr:AAA family ATPase [Candidatus Parvarchaeota archaeon]MCL5101415.1 AAA family ATPase [Candidatus Parvarchaeota archaeon]
MLANNPFINITSTGKEKVVDRVNERIELQLYINDGLSHGKIIIIKGNPGVGKSTLINTIINDLKKTRTVEFIKEEFTPSVYNRLRTINIMPMKKILIVLDDFNNVELLDKTSQTKVLNLMDELAQKACVIVVENRNEGVEKDFKKLGKRFEKFELSGLQRSDLRQLIVDRLNSIRQVPRDNLDPFTEEEYDKIFRKAGGNPRIALLICSTLYDQKETSII